MSTNKGMLLKSHIQVNRNKSSKSLVKALFFEVNVLTTITDQRTVNMCMTPLVKVKYSRRAYSFETLAHKDTSPLLTSWAFNPFWKYKNLRLCIEINMRRIWPDYRWNIVAQYTSNALKTSLFLLTHNTSCDWTTKAGEYMSISDKKTLRKHIASHFFTFICKITTKIIYTDCIYYLW